MSLVLDGTAGMTAPQGAVYNGIQSGTAVASTSGTSITFTGIPSWAKRVTVMFNGVSMNASASICVQLGTSGGVVSTGYLGSYNNFAVSPTAQYPTTYFGLTASSSAAGTLYGNVTLANVSGNTWIESHSMGIPSADGVSVGGGGITLASALTQVTITTAAGTATFDAGSINILYE